MKHLKPARPDLVIYDPRTRKQVPLAGITVNERAPFWARRLVEGSMVVVDVPATPSPKA